MSRTRDVFPSCRNVKTRHGTFAYVRLATFNVENDQAFLREFIRIVLVFPGWVTPTEAVA